MIPTITATVTDADLYAYYNFDSGITDVTGNTTTLINTGTTSTTGKVSNGRSFDGATTYLATPWNFKDD